MYCRYLQCSKKCIADDCSAQNHTLKVSLFERTEYLHKGKTKKKLQLVDKVLTPVKFVDVLKTTLICFPCHLNHTSKVYDQAMARMTNSTIVKIQDFTENYNVLPEEIMSVRDYSRKLFWVVISYV